MSRQGGDDLDDDFVPDDLVALSGDEGEHGEEPQSYHSEHVMGGDEDGEVHGETDQQDQKNQVAVEKKRKRKQMEKQKKAKVCRLFLLGHDE